MKNDTENKTSSWHEAICLLEIHLARWRV